MPAARGRLQAILLLNNGLLVRQFDGVAPVPVMHPAFSACARSPQGVQFCWRF
jgi:hypothetical protein